MSVIVVTYLVIFFLRYTWSHWLRPALLILLRNNLKKIKNMALLTFYSSIAFKSPRSGIPKSFSKIPDTSSATVHKSKHTFKSDTFLKTSASCFLCSLTLSLQRMNATTTTPASWVPPLSTWATTMLPSTMPTARRWTSPVTSLKPTLQGIMIISFCCNDPLFWFCLKV